MDLSWPHLWSIEASFIFDFLQPFGDVSNYQPVRPENCNNFILVLELQTKTLKSCLRTYLGTLQCTVFSKIKLDHLLARFVNWWTTSFICMQLEFHKFFPAGHYFWLGYAEQLQQRASSPIVNQHHSRADAMTGLRVMTTSVLKYIYSPQPISGFTGGVYKVPFCFWLHLTIS